MPEDLREAWAERVAIMVAEGGLPGAEAERRAWAGLQPQRHPPADWRGVAAPSGAHRAKGWGGAARLPLGLDTRCRTG